MLSSEAWQRSKVMLIEIWGHPLCLPNSWLMIISVYLSTTLLSNFIRALVYTAIMHRSLCSLPIISLYYFEINRNCSFKMFLNRSHSLEHARMYIFRNYLKRCIKIYSRLSWISNILRILFNSAFRNRIVLSFPMMLCNSGFRLIISKCPWFLLSFYSIF